MGVVVLHIQHPVESESMFNIQIRRKKNDKIKMEILFFVLPRISK